MKYGMPTLLEFNSIEENVLYAKNNNLSFIELNMNLPYCFNIRRKELLKYDIEFTMHISEELHIGELNKHLYNSYMKEIVRQIKIGISNNIKRYNIHLNQGIYFTLPNGKNYLCEKNEKIYKEHIIKSFEILNKLAEENNIFINFENTKVPTFIKNILSMLENYSNLGITLDIGHNEKNDNKAWNAIKDKKIIKYVHLHDYDGKKDHLSLGTGIIDFSKYENVIKKCYNVIEIKEVNELLESIAYIKNNKLFIK